MMVHKLITILALVVCKISASRENICDLIVPSSNRLQFNPNFHKMARFLVDRWVQARREISPEGAIVNGFVPLVYLSRFYQYDSGLIFWNVNGTFISYARIYKCANEAIGLNMDHRMSGPSKKSQRLEVVDPMQYYLLQEELQLDRKASNLKQNMPHHHIFVGSQGEPVHPYVIEIRKFLDSLGKKPTDLNTFTFVREPMKRFESGLAEAVWVTGLPFHREFLGLWTLNSTADVKQYIHQLLDLTMFMPIPPLLGIHHVYAQFGVLSKYKTPHVGYLESFKEDWNNKIAPVYNMTSYPFDESMGVHANSINHPDSRPRRDKTKNYGDPNNFRRYYRQLLRQEPQYERAICNIMLIDYVCLPRYKLPLGCRHLNEARREGANILLL